MGAWPSLQALMDRDGSFQLDIWRASQLLHFLQIRPTPDTFCRDLTTLEYCFESGTFPYALSTMCNLLVSPSEGFLLPYLAKWESNLGRTFRKTQQTNITRFTLKSSICTNQLQDSYSVVPYTISSPQILPDHLCSVLEMPRRAGDVATHFLVV